MERIFSLNGEKPWKAKKKARRVDFEVSIDGDGDLMVKANGYFLFFVSRIDGKLHMAEYIGETTYLDLDKKRRVRIGK